MDYSRYLLAAESMKSSCRAVALHAHIAYTSLVFAAFKSLGSVP